MENKTLENFIHEANNTSSNEVFSKYEISENVDLALAWLDKPEVITGNEKGYRIYLIKFDGAYVAAVFEMGSSDLHWFVLTEFRKQGILYKALHTYILPHIFLDGRKMQRASFDSKENKQYLIRQGFEVDPSGTNALILKNEKVKSFDINKVKRTRLSGEKAKRLQEEMMLLAVNMRQIADKLFCAYGDDCNLYVQASAIVSEAYDVEYFVSKKGVA